MKIKALLKTFTLTAALLASFALASQALSFDFDVETSAEPTSPSLIRDDAGFFGDSPFELPESFTEFVFVPGEKPSSFTYHPQTDDDASASLFSVFFTGDGTEESPYLLSDADDLERFSSTINSDTTGAYTKAYYKLTTDIDLNGVEWMPVGYYAAETEYSTTFQGVFDGDGHTVSNFVISEDCVYAGFFGLVYNGTVKNLTISNAKISLSTNNVLYAGGLVGRFLALGNKKTAAIENCHVKDVTLFAESKAYSVYTGSLAGYLHASQGASLTVSGCSTDAQITGKSSGYASSASSDTRFNLTIGGFAGYVGSRDEDSTLTIANSYSLARVNGTSAVTRSKSDNLKAGGFLGYFGSAAGASIQLSCCYAAGGVVTEAIAENYSGGLLGYLVASASGVSIENCYTSSNVYGKSTANTAYLGGFSSVAGSSSNADFSLDNSYCVGSVVDTGSRDSESGRFVADAQADVQGGILTSGCYVLADSLLAGKTFSSSETALVKELTAEKAADLTSYFGYSEKIWKNGTAPYTYPVLIATPSSAPHVKAFFYEENTVFHAEDVSFGGTAAAFTETPDSHYVFSHWSLIPNGEAVKLADTRLLCDTLFFANFTNEYRSYKIDFMADGKLLQTDTLIYGSPIVFPQAPEKESDQAFRYVFTHWSDSENGPDNVKNATVSGDMVFYAVYARIETGVWDGKTADAFVKGSGTKDDPFSILTPANLYFLSQNVGTDAYNTAYYVLESDIDLGGHEWTPIGSAETPFRGHFDGAGYSVNNFQITREQAYVGVFGLIENGIVSKLAVSNFTVNMQAADTEAVYIGSVAGKIQTKGTNILAEITECTADGTIRASGDSLYVGGIVGEAIVSDDTMRLNIQNCYSLTALDINAKSLAMAGGIAGRFNGATLGISGIDRCYSAGTISSKSPVSAYAGGIVGFLFDTDAYIETALSATASLSEIAENGTVRNSFATGDLTAEAGEYACYAGQIYAYKNSEATMKNCVGYKEMKLTASKIQYADRSEELPETFFTAAFLETLGFDTETVWQLNDAALPTLRYEATAKNVYRIKEFRYDTETETVVASLVLGFRDVECYQVLIGAYDNRGKMVDFQIKTVENPSSVQTVTVELDDIETAESCTLSIVDATTLALLRDPLELRF